MRLSALLAASLLVASAPITAQPDPLDRVDAYPVPAGTLASNDFTVTVNGRPVPVEEQRDISTVHFAFAGTARVTVTYREPIASSVLSPLASAPSATVEGRTLSFTLTRPSKLALHGINGTQANRITEPRLLIFADAPEVAPPRPGQPDVVDAAAAGVAPDNGLDATGPLQRLIDSTSRTGKTLHIGAGVYTLSDALLPRKNTKLYLAPGARLRTARNAPGYVLSVLALNNVSNVRIWGRGSLDGNGVYLRYGGGSGAQVGTIRSSRADTVSVDGLVLRDPSGFNVFIRRSQGWTLTDLKLIDYQNEDLGDFAGTDGIDPDEARAIDVSDTFIGAGDDVTAIKVAVGKRFAELGAISYRNSLFWNFGSGVALGVGGEFRIGARMVDVSWENIDVVRSLYGLYAETAKKASIRNLVYKGIRYETEVDGAFFALDPKGGALIDVVLDGVSTPGLGSFGPGGLYGNYVRGTGPSAGITGVFDEVVVGGRTLTGFVPTEIETNPFATIAFTAQPSRVVEIDATAPYARAGAPAQVVLRRAGPTAEALTVPLEIGGSARAGVDYPALPASVTFAAGQAEVVLFVQPQGSVSTGRTVLIGVGATPYARTWTVGPRWRVQLVLG